MVRMADLVAEEQAHMKGLDLPRFETEPWVSGPPLPKRRVAIITSAGLGLRGDQNFQSGASDYRVIPGDVPAGDILMSHVSVNFDRTGFQEDINVVFPIERLREMRGRGEIGSVAGFHYSVMGATDPMLMRPAIEKVAGMLRQDAVDAVLLTPV